MSRVGKYPVTVPTGVQVSITGGTFLAKGKFGELGFKLSDLVKATFDNSKVIIQPLDNSQQSRMMWGTTRALVANIVTGVSVGYTKILEIEGTGFRAALQGKDLIMNLGFSHDVVYEIPKGVKIVCEKPTLVKIEGADKRLVGQVAVEIQSFRPPEPYKGKGIKFEGKPILRKEGKKK